MTKQFVDFNVGNFFKVREPFGNQELRKEFVNVKRVHEQLRA